jgi:hypothetical protein
MVDPLSPRVQTRAFLKLLDPNEQEFHFRTFDDKRDLARLPLIGNLSGTIANVERILLSRNASEAGVFVVINKGGQKKSDIKRIRAVFADTDGAPLDPIVDALAPHAVIESSPGNYHVYWLVNDGFPVDMFTPIQNAISAKFGTDPNVKDLPRVMRLPGFKHNKYDPVDVKFHSVNAKLPYYSASEITNGLGLAINPAKTSNPIPEPHELPLLDALRCNTVGLIDLERMLKHIDPSCSRDEWMNVCFAMAYEYGESSRDLFKRWSQGDLWTGGYNATK